MLEVKSDEDQNIFLVTVLEGGKERIYLGRQLVIASGGQNGIPIPSFAETSRRVFNSYTQVNTKTRVNILTAMCLWWAVRNPAPK